MAVFLKSTLGLLLVSYTLSAVINPKLTEWRLIKKDYERHLFPLRDYILEVKSFLPDEYDTSPAYNRVLFKTEKPTTMMVYLFEGTYANKVGRLVWNTIKLDNGYDVAIEQCDARYRAYNSFLANRETEQIWAWNFFDDHVELTCNGELQYERNFAEGEFHPFLLEIRPAKCAALGTADVDKLIFKHMKGFYVRGVPKVL